MYGSAGRSGHHRNTNTPNWDDWTGLSENGRQYRNELTKEVRDISGSEYWNLRKELSPKTGEVDVIRASDYKTPSYYHVKKETTLNVATDGEIEAPNVDEGEAKPEDSFVLAMVVLGLVITGATLFHLL